MKPTSNDILPQPFAWIPIPEGTVTLIADDLSKKKSYLKQDTTYTIPAFEMAKYPITNAQFKLFIDAGGYDEKRWWTDDGWRSKLDGWVYERGWGTGKAWTKPRFWDDSTWNGAEHPVVGVSWYETVAFCNWLSETTGEKIMLPTEQQWQRAAQGNNRLIYPWGNDWDGNLCNNSVKPHNSEQTTPVRQYEGKGDSPFSVVDMAGNVWEWCKTAYETGTDDVLEIGVRVLRGGSWGSTKAVIFRAVNRSSADQYNWNDVVGFRIARLSKN
ncbi:MAG: SUMF1/EgtB/PvdO family nonheme iron enzyme [bacterium]|nr:SUMF1/EgtB/PvdO family nonheme iron enzyme [bacterium]